MGKWIDEAIEAVQGERAQEAAEQQRVEAMAMSVKERLENADMRAERVSVSLPDDQTVVVGLVDSPGSVNKYGLFMWANQVLVPPDDPLYARFLEAMLSERTYAVHRVKHPGKPKQHHHKELA